MIKFITRIISFIITITILFAIAVFSANIYVLKTGEKNIKSSEEIPESTYILVFGASVNGKNVSHALSQRLDMAVKLYKNKKGYKLIVSGDHISANYNEVQAMKDYLVKKGIPASKITMDHSGVDTYTSVVHLKDMIADDSIIFVTQEEHLKRALYFANKLNINAYGVYCENYSEEQLEFQHKREFLARMKAFVLCEFFDGNVTKFNEVLKMVYNENFD